MDRRLLWLWLTTKEKMTAAKITKILDCAGDLCDVYQMTEKDYLACGIDTRLIDSLCDKSLASAEKVLKKTRKYNIDIMTVDDEDYPKNLLNIFDPPYVLYLVGNRMNLNERLLISIVGTRRCTMYGYSTAAQIGYDLGRCGVVVVSGMAEGIDAASHIGAMKAGGTTVAVLANGLDTCYPSSNYNLMKSIMDTGMILSEYPPGVGAYKTNFPVRNRIISGIASGVLVAEAPVKSGALITARTALEQSRDVFCVPGNVNNEMSRGTNRFIRDEGGKLTECAADILIEYTDYFAKMKSELSSKEGIKRFSLRAFADKLRFDDENKLKAVELPKLSDNPEYEGLTDEEQKVLSKLLAEPMHIDELAKKTKTEMAKLGAILTMLEINGFIESKPGKQFCLKT